MIPEDVVIKALTRMEDKQENLIDDVKCLQKSIKELNDRVSSLETEVAEARGKTKAINLVMGILSATGGAGIASAALTLGGVI